MTQMLMQPGGFGFTPLPKQFPEMLVVTAGQAAYRACHHQHTPRDPNKLGYGTAALLGWNMLQRIDARNQIEGIVRKGQCGDGASLQGQIGRQRLSGFGLHAHDGNSRQESGDSLSAAAYIQQPIAWPEVWPKRGDNRQIADANVPTPAIEHTAQ